MSSVRELVDAIANGDTIEIQNQFNDQMSSRLSTVLDVYKTELAKNMFNPHREVEDEVEVEEVEAETTEEQQ